MIEIKDFSNEPFVPVSGRLIRIQKGLVVHIDAILMANRMGNYTEVTFDTSKSPYLPEHKMIWDEDESLWITINSLAVRFTP